jgi:hypothetical protein
MSGAQAQNPLRARQDEPKFELSLIPQLRKRLITDLSMG